MSENLTTYTLDKLLSVKHGFPFLGEFFSSEGHFVVLTPGNFYEKGGFKRVYGKEKFYLSTFPDDYLCRRGELIVAMTEQAEGLLGSTALVPENGIYLHNQRIGLIQHKPEIVDKYYLYCLFMTKSVRKQLRDSSSGTKVKHTSPDKIYGVQVSIPNLEVQKRNAQLLQILDQKLQLNTKISQELEEMAKTLYDYWFVQFDFPDEQGKPYRSSGGKMVFCEELNREIPEGWGVTNVEHLVSILDSERVPLSKKQRSEIKGNIPYYGAAEIVDYVNDYLFDGQYVLLAEDGSVMDSEGFPILQMIWGKSWVNNHAHVLQGKMGTVMN